MKGGRKEERRKGGNEFEVTFGPLWRHFGNMKLSLGHLGGLFPAQSQPPFFPKQKQQNKDVAQRLQTKPFCSPLRQWQ